MNVAFLFLVHISLSSGKLKLKGILKIASASNGRNKEWITLTFHQWVSSLIRDETIGKSTNSLIGEITLYVDGVGSHSSSQMWIFQPLPTHHLVPFLITSKLLWILRQA